MRRIPQRSCIGCRAVRDKKELVRLVRTPEGELRLDPTGKAAGRGAYLCLSAECLALAARRKSFDRAFRQTLPKEALAALESGLEEYLRAHADRAVGRSGAAGASGG